MSKTKNKKLLVLKKLVSEQRGKYGITENFSYRFDYKSKKLVLCYTIAKAIRDGNGLRTKMINKEKYNPIINEKNFRRYFKGTTTILRDDEKFVKDERQKAEKKYDVGLDETDFRYWIEDYLHRTTGFTTKSKLLSPLTIKSNKFHLNEYFDWCLDNHNESDEIDLHIDSGVDWFREYYEQRLRDGKWNPTTVGISYRNIRGFYNHIANRTKGKFPYDILRPLKIKKADNKRDSINSWEYEKIIDFIINKMDDVFWGKFILMMRLQLKTGMRVGELVSIRNRNIDINSKRIQIVGKGDRSRELNFGHDDDQKIWEDLINKKHRGIYLFHRTRVQNFPKEGRVIEVDIDLNKPTTSSYYLQRFRQMRELLGLRGKNVITSHSLRRYFITTFISENPHQRDLCRMIVGHSTTRMTDYYVGNMIHEDTKTTISIGV